MENVMSSRVLSRFLPVAEGDVSVYEGIRRPAVRHSDMEAQRPLVYQQSFHDDDEDGVPEAFLYDMAQESAMGPVQSPEIMASPSQPRTQDLKGKQRVEDDEDVPESLLLEPRRERQVKRNALRIGAEAKFTATKPRWRVEQEREGIHLPRTSRSVRLGSRPSAAGPALEQARPNPEANAMWLYTNAENLDTFLLEVYQYFVDHGVWSILLSRLISLLTELFVFSFAMFLSTCIDYSKVPTSRSSSEVMVAKCMSKASWLKNAALFFFVIYWLTRLISHARNARRLFQMRGFYQHVLGISDEDIQTVSWVRIVEGLVKVQNANIATANSSAQARKYLDYKEPQQRLSAESIANRLMRQANYYVALYNKDIIDFTLPLPFVGMRQFYSKSLEWCIDFCLTNFIFDERGSIRSFCLEVRNRSALVEALRSRLRFAAVVSIIIAPFNILRFCVLYFFKYYTEFTKNPSRASARTFTPFAEWKIREFNELDHLFQRRIRQAAPFANDYLKQFPKDKTDQVARFVAFVSGAIAAVLALATLFDPELFLGFEVTPGRTAVFWLTLMGIIFGVAHGALPDENEVHEPVLHLKAVLLYTHYMPAHWKDRLHSNEVRAEFSSMFQMKVLIFIEEILSLIVAPWILWRNSGDQCERIIDFFREQTVHVEGIGYQCNFAVFGFKKDLNAEDPTTVLNEPDGLRDDYYGAKDDKMAQSVQNFMHYYSHHNLRQANRRSSGWQPPPAWPPVISPPAITEEPGLLNPGIHQSSTLTRKADVRRERQRIPVSALKSLKQSSSQASERATRQRQDISESGLMAQDSDLQDFADAPGANQLESDTEADEATGPGAAVNAGVLGMLAQFSKAQTEKGAGAVHI